MNQENLKPKIFGGRGRIITDILGRSKYSNYDQALNEAVANSLDWDATKLYITLNKKFIEVRDNGVGMSDDILLNRYLRLGEENLYPDKRGKFGIGVCANAGLGDRLIVESRQRDLNKGRRIEIDFHVVESKMIGEYEPELYEEINFKGKDYSTLIRIEKLRWENINVDDFSKYLQEKHFPLLLDKDLNIHIYLNGIEFKVIEPESTEKYEFDSYEVFSLENKYIPQLKDLSCGRIQGTFYLNEETWEEPSIDLYVMNQRIDGYSGDRVDWLGLKNLSTAEGFKRRIKGIIKVEAVEEKVVNFSKPLKGLVIKSDRTEFFENKAFNELCAYLNGTIKNRYIGNLPFGGILRIINDNWYRKRGVDIEKTKTLIDKFKSELMPDLNEILKNEQIKPKSVDDVQEDKKTRQKPEHTDSPVYKNLMFKCPKCTNIVRVLKENCYKLKKLFGNEKVKFQEKYWTCDACGYLLDPDKDKYKTGPIKGTRLAKLALEEGALTDIIADALGKDGPRAIYNPDEGVIKINTQHSLLIYALKTSDESFKCNLLDSILYSIALRRSEDKKMEFQKIYNDVCSNVTRVIDVQEYEKALDKFRS